MYSIGLLMTLRPGCLAPYKQAHDRLWPEIAKSMAMNGVSMVIFHTNDRLFIHAIAPTEVDWLASRRSPALARWHEHMATMLMTDASGKIAFQPLETVFEFGRFGYEHK